MSFPSLGITEMTASLQEGGITAYLRVQLNYEISGGEIFVNVLNHSEGRPSLPGILLFLRLFNALSNSSCAISFAKRLFCLKVKRI